MNISFENINKRIINPVWSSSQGHSICTNMWPVRQTSHSRRFYSIPKLRMSYESEPRFKPEIAPMAVKVDVEQYNKHKSQSSMAFCSTSKVKYMPLHGFSNDGFANLKWSAHSSGIFPMISRPTSRPVILHGKRYTILAVDDDRPFICSTAKDEDKVSQRTETFSDQRRRFNETERHKFKTRICKDNTETSQFRIKRNYCLSGHSVSIRSSRETVEERMSRLQPMMNLVNNATKEQTHRHDERVSVNDINDEDVKTFSIEKAITVESGVSCDPAKEAIHRNDSNGSVISVDIVSGKKTEAESSKLTEAIWRVLGEVKQFETNQDSIDRSKEWLSQLICSHVERDQVMDCGTIEDSWALLLPKETTIQEETQDSFLFASSKEVDWSTFVDGMEDEGRDLWSKILALLKIYTVDSSLYLKITRLSALFQDDREIQELSTNVALNRLCFWIQLFAVLFRMLEDSTPDFSNFLDTLIKIMANRNDLNEDEESCVQESIVHFANTSLQQANQNVETEVLIDTIPWIFKTHKTIFNRPMTIDDLARSMTTLSNKFEK